MKLASTLFLVGLLAASGAQAMDLSDMYVGVNLGKATAKVPTGSAWAAPAPGDALSVNDKDTSYKIFAGSKVMDFLSVEGGYANLGRWSRRDTRLNGDWFEATGKTQGLYADGVLTYSISSSFSLLARLGYGYYWQSFTNAANVALPAGAVTNGNSIVKGFQYGLGAQFDVSKSIALRAEWDRKPQSFTFGGKTFGSDNISLGLLYKF